AGADAPRVDEAAARSDREVEPADAVPARPTPARARPVADDREVARAVGADLQPVARAPGPPDPPAPRDPRLRVDPLRHQPPEPVPLDLAEERLAGAADVVGEAERPGLGEEAGEEVFPLGERERPEVPLLEGEEVEEEEGRGVGGGGALDRAPLERRA